MIPEFKYNDLEKDYKKESLNLCIELDKKYCEQEMKILDQNAIDYTKLTNIQNLRKSNLMLLLRISIVGKENYVDVETNIKK